MAGRPATDDVGGRPVLAEAEDHVGVKLPADVAAAARAALAAGHEGVVVKAANADVLEKASEQVRDEVAKLDDALATLRDLATRLGGYVANTSVTTGRDQTPTGTIELKIPSARYDSALVGLEPLGKVESVNTMADDVGEVRPAGFFQDLALAGVQVTPAGALAAALSGGVTSGLGYVVWYAALTRLSATRAATIWSSSSTPSPLFPLTRMTSAGSVMTAVSISPITKSGRVFSTISR